MKDKIVLLIKETGCEQGEAELALEMCGYDVEKAVKAIPHLFQNIAVLKGKAEVQAQTLYLLFLVILNLKNRTLLRARAVASYNPAIFNVTLETDWFRFEKHLYACRLRDGAVQSMSQDVERLLADYFVSSQASHLYSEAQRDSRGKGSLALTALLSQYFSPHEARLQLHKDVLDMGQFHALAGKTPSSASRGPRSSWPSSPDPGSPFSRRDRPQLPDSPLRRSERKAEFMSARGERPAPGQGYSEAETPGSLVLRITLEEEPEGVFAGELMAGDLVYAHISDTRDVARYLAKLFGAQLEEDSPLLVPVEAVETYASVSGSESTCVRVRFSLGVCGDAYLRHDQRIKTVRKVEPAPWWRKLFGS